MSKIYSLTPLVGAHYPERMPNGRTIMRSEPPSVAVLIVNDTSVPKKNDEPADGQREAGRHKPIDP